MIQICVSTWALSLCFLDLSLRYPFTTLLGGLPTSSSVNNFLSEKRKREREKEREKERKRERKKERKREGEKERKRKREKDVKR